MIEALSGLIVDESKWLSGSIAFALLAVAILLYRFRMSEYSGRERILAAMNLFFGAMIGIMAFGHLLAVTTKLVMGTLEGSTLLFYLIGLALAIPSWWLFIHAYESFNANGRSGQKTIVLNTWLALTLLVMGIHNLPLAAPAFLNIAYQLNSQPRLGWALVGAAVVLNVGLLIGSLIFLASGQSFEQFRGIN